MGGSTVVGEKTPAGEWASPPTSRTRKATSIGLWETARQWLTPRPVARRLEPHLAGVAGTGSGRGPGVARLPGMAATGFHTADELNALLPGHAAGPPGVTDQPRTSRAGRTPQLDVRSDLLAPNGYLHAATVVGLADTACGWPPGAPPEGSTGFTTIELKTNFLGTVREGRIAVVATNVHAGRTTQVWDAVVTDAVSGRTIALFRCTQSVLWPR